jgi:hypothetical protein
LRQKRTSIGSFVNATNLWLKRMPTRLLSTLCTNPSHHLSSDLCLLTKNRSPTMTLGRFSCSPGTSKLHQR